MAVKKTPRADCNQHAGQDNRASARSPLRTSIVAEAEQGKNSAMSRRKERRARFERIRETFARDAGLPFGKLLQREYVLSVFADLGLEYRTRTYCPLVCLWGWLSQCLSQDKSLREVVSRIIAHRVSHGLPACSANSASYSNARSRFPLEALQRMAREIGRKVHDSRDAAWDWRGRPIYLVDGTGLSAADSPENRLEWPPSGAATAGVGLPIMRAVALISLSTGTVVDFAFGKHKGKGTGEMSLLREMQDSLPAGSLLIGDRYYPGFATVAMLQSRGVDLIAGSHQRRIIDFNEGQILGPQDHIVEWHLQRSQKYENKINGRSLPATVKVREFVINIESRDGGKEPVIITTTLTDPSIPQEEIAALYLKRWHVEVDLRSIKQSLHLDILRAKSPAMAHKELWAHLLAWNLLRGVMVETAKRHDAHPRQLSTKATMQTIESFCPAMMNIDGSDVLYNAMLTTVSASRVGNRPGRLEPRLKKTRPAWKHYLMKPRHEYRRRLAKDCRATGVALS